MFILTTVIGFAQPQEEVEPHYQIAMTNIEAENHSFQNHSLQNYFLQNQPQSSHLSSQYYPSELEAVIAAANRFNPLSIRQDREYIGAILKHTESGQFSYTVTAGYSGQDKITAEVLVPDHHEIMAFWHTHGSAKDTRHLFSATDIKLVKQWQLPFYLADHTGWLKVLKPGDRPFTHHQARINGIYSGVKVAPGSRVTDSSGEFITVKNREF